MVAFIVLEQDKIYFQYKNMWLLNTITVYMIIIGIGKYSISLSTLLLHTLAYWKQVLTATIANIKKCETNSKLCTSSGDGVYWPRKSERSNQTNRLWFGRWICWWNFEFFISKHWCRSPGKLACEYKSFLLLPATMHKISLHWKWNFIDWIVVEWNIWMRSNTKWYYESTAQRSPQLPRGH